MMQPRCAICDADNDLMTLCHMHSVLTEKRAKVQSGALTDFGVGGVNHPLNHQAQMTSSAIAHARALRMRQYPQRRDYPEAQMMIELAVTLAGCDVEFDDGSTSGMDSYGDGLARYHLIDWQRINNDSGDSGKGQAA